MTKYRPFSNVEHYTAWAETNCDNCKKSQSPEQYVADLFGCDIDKALARFYAGDEDILKDIAERMGLHDNYGKHNWQCPEFEQRQYNQ